MWLKHLIRVDYFSKELFLYSEIKRSDRMWLVLEKSSLDTLQLDLSTDSCFK